MKLVPHCLFVILFVFFLLTGLVGIDFGSHFEEERLLNSVEQSKRTGLFIPRWYNYPSFSYDLCLLAMAPEMVFSLPPIPNESTMALFPEPSSRPAENPSDPSSLISIHAEKVFPTTTEQPSALASTVVLPEITKLIEPTPSMEPQEAAGSSLTVKHHSEPVDVTEPAGYLDTEGAAPSRYEPETAAQPTPTSAGIVAESLKKAPRSEPALMNITATSASIAGLSAASSFTVLFITAEQRISNDVKFRTASSHPLTLRIRSIFLLISAISMLWIYLGVGLWRKNWITALLAASFMGLSWEMAYHAPLDRAGCDICAICLVNRVLGFYGISAFYPSFLCPDMAILLGGSSRVRLRDGIPWGGIASACSLHGGFIAAGAFFGKTAAALSSHSGILCGGVCNYYTCCFCRTVQCFS